MATTKRTTPERWTEAEARRVLGECKASGLSPHAFAVRELINPQRLYWWAKRLGGRGQGRGRNPEPLRFVPGVVVPAAMAMTTSASITIRVGDRARLEIVDPVVTPAGWVAAVLAELERLSCS